MGAASERLRFPLLFAATEVIHVFDATEHQAHQANRCRLLRATLRRVQRPAEAHRLPPGTAQGGTGRRACWGYAGDLGRVTEELAYVLSSLGDRSAVDQKGLEY